MGETSSEVLTLPPDALLVRIGSAGCGKTTFARAPLPADPGRFLRRVPPAAVGGKFKAMHASIEGLPAEGFIGVPVLRSAEEVERLRIESTAPGYISGTTPASPNVR